MFSKSTNKTIKFYFYCRTGPPAAGGPGVKNENDNKMKMNTYVNIYSNMGILALR